MTDIVERLNEIQPHWCVASVETKTVYEVGQICADAKDEIERLREALREIKGIGFNEHASKAIYIAFTALGEGK